MGTRRTHLVLIRQRVYMLVTVRREAWSTFVTGGPGEARITLARVRARRARNASAVLIADI